MFIPVFAAKKLIIATMRCKPHTIASIKITDPALFKNYALIPAASNFSTPVGIEGYENIFGM